MSRILSLSGGTLLCIALTALVGWPALATVDEAMLAGAGDESTQPASGTALDKVTAPGFLHDSSNFARQSTLALESARLVLETETIALPLGILLAFFLFRTDAFANTPLIGLIIVAAFVPLPLHTTSWLNAFGNTGRNQLFGWQPLLVGRSGAAFVHAMAALPWVVLIIGMGLCAVEPELEESALLDFGPACVLRKVTLRRALASIAAAALAVAVLTAGDMTVTDLLVIRTYAEESYWQYTQGRGPGDAAQVAVPPLCLLGLLILLVGRSLSRLDPSRIASSFTRARVWSLGAWRITLGLFLWLFVGNGVALPLYGLVWRAGRLGGNAAQGRPNQWSLSGFYGTLLRALEIIGRPLLWSLFWTASAATIATLVALSLAWAARRSGIWNAIAMATLCLTLATPGPVAGMALILAYRPFPSVYDSPIMIVMAQTLRSLPYAVLLLWPFLRSIPQDYLDSTALDGLDRPRQFLRVVIPLASRPIVAAWAIAFAISLGELAATNIATPPMKSGRMPVSVVIWALLHTGVDSDLAGVTLIVLLVVVGVALCALAAIYSLKAIAWPRALTE